MCFAFDDEDPWLRCSAVLEEAERRGKETHVGGSATLQAPESAHGCPTGPSDHAWTAGLMFAAMRFGYSPVERVLAGHFDEWVEMQIEDTHTHMAPPTQRSGLRLRGLLLGARSMAMAVRGHRWPILREVGRCGCGSPLGAEALWPRRRGTRGGVPCAPVAQAQPQPLRHRLAASILRRHTFNWNDTENIGPCAMMTRFPWTHTRRHSEATPLTPQG